MPTKKIIKLSGGKNLSFWEFTCSNQNSILSTYSFRQRARESFVLELIERTLGEEGAGDVTGVFFALSDAAIWDSVAGKVS